MTLLEAALRYAEAGWPVLPLSGKVPITSHGVKDATTDERKIRTWWAACSSANIGLAMGNGRLALDVDGAVGLETLAQLQREHGELSPTLTSQTGVGLHKIFSIDRDATIRNAVKFLPGLDTRSAGGYIVAPPSVHASGHRYRWINREAPAPLPAWLAELVKPRVAEVTPTAPIEALQGDDATCRKCGVCSDCHSGTVQRGCRSCQTRAACRLCRARAYLARMPGAISGSGGHLATWKAAIALVRGFALSPETALQLLLGDFNGRCDPPWSRSELEYKVKQASGARMSSGFLLTARSAA